MPRGDGWDQGEALNARGDQLAVRTAPVHAPVVKGRCSAGVTPCGATARLYAQGWLCDDHRPGGPLGQRRHAHATT